MSLEDRAALSSGICHVLATLPSDQRFKAFEGMASLPLSALEKWSGLAKDARTSTSELSVILPRIGGEIFILSTMSRSFATAITSGNDDGMRSGCDTSPDRLAPVPASVLQTLHKAWSNILFAASNWVEDEVRSSLLNIVEAFYVASDVRNYTRFVLDHRFGDDGIAIEPTSACWSRYRKRPIGSRALCCSDRCVQESQ